MRKEWWPPVYDCVKSAGDEINKYKKKRQKKKRNENSEREGMKERENRKWTDIQQ